jgi:hypothetical protein
MFVLPCLHHLILPAVGDTGNNARKVILMEEMEMILDVKLMEMLL